MSRLQLASKFPELEYATLLHSVSWPSNKLMHSHSPAGLNALSSSSSPSCAQTPIFESNEAVANVLPEGDHAIARTVFECPVGMVVTCENLTEVVSDASGSEEMV